MRFVILFFYLLTTTVISTATNDSSPLPKFPWSENVAKLEFTTRKPKIGARPNLTKAGLIEEVRSGHIPQELVPFVNISKIDELRKENNETLDFIIRDEDVADIPDDEDDEVSRRKVNTITHDGNKTIVTISDEAREQLYQHWLDQSLSGLMGAVVTDVINRRKLTKNEKKSHYNCTQNAKNVTAHAKCVVAVYDQVKKRNDKLKVYSTLTNRATTKLKKKQGNLESWKKSLHSYEKYVKSGGEEFRVKRAVEFNLFDHLEKTISRKDIKSQKSYTLQDTKSLSPLALIARRLTEMVRAIKNTKEPPKRWQQIIREIKDESTRIKSKKKNRDRLKRKFTKFVDVMKQSGINPKRAIGAMGMEDMFEDEPILTEREQEIQDKKDMMARMKPEDRIMHEPIKLIREGIKIGMLAGGRNISNFDEKKIAFLSPQFMSILPDEVANDTVSLLSPSILSLHGEGSELDRKLSLTKALKLMADTGQEEWMNFVMEASGVTEAVEKIRTAEKKEDEEERRRDFVDKDGRPLYFTRENITQIYGEYEAKKIDLLEGIYKSMTPEQMEAMNKTGYSIMDDSQLEMMYGSGSPYNDTISLAKFKNIDRADMPRLIERDIRALSKEQYKFEISRKKDIVLNPLVLMSVVLDPVTASQSIILSPVVLTPIILSPSIYGNVILSPWVFVPVIVAPRILGAVVLSPVVFSPAVLTPLCMVPIILSPAVGLPLVLSPFVLSPFILSPVAMAPLILSPFCLSPFIGIPNVLTPLVLSPFVLSPLILSPPFVSAFVLTPYALSPAVLSNGALFTAVLSPSWLSTL